MRIKELTEQFNTLNIELINLAEQLTLLYDAKTECYSAMKNPQLKEEELLKIQEKIFHLDAEYMQCKMILAEKREARTQIKLELDQEADRAASVIKILNKGVKNLTAMCLQFSVSTHMTIEYSAEPSNSTQEKVETTAEKVKETVTETKELIKRSSEQTARINGIIDVLVQRGVFATEPPSPEATQTEAIPPTNGPS